MKLIVPISKVEEVLPIIEAGADELYCGVLPLEWYKKYTNVASINRAERMRSNLKNFDELKQIVKMAHSYNIPVSLALNSIYTEDQYPLLFIQFFSLSIEDAIDFRLEKEKIVQRFIDLLRFYHSLSHKDPCINKFARIFKCISSRRE